MGTFNLLFDIDEIISGFRILPQEIISYLLPENSNLKKISFRQYPQNILQILLLCLIEIIDIVL